VFLSLFTSIDSKVSTYNRQIMLYANADGGRAGSAAGWILYIQVVHE